MQIYLSYLKPPALDMKWENRDINVVEQANIPKLSKLDNIVISLRYFESFFGDALADMSVGYTTFQGYGGKADTTFYGYGGKAGTSFEITNETFCLF